MLWTCLFSCTRNHLLGFQKPILSFNLNSLDLSLFSWWTSHPPMKSLRHSLLSTLESDNPMGTIHQCGLPTHWGGGWIGVKAGTVKWITFLLIFTLRGGLFRCNLLNRCLSTWFKNLKWQKETQWKMFTLPSFCFLICLPVSPPNRKLLVLVSVVSWLEFPYVYWSKNKYKFLFFSLIFMKGIILYTLFWIFLFFLTYWFIRGIFHINT